jgi:hypothetical protein
MILEAVLTFSICVAPNDPRAGTWDDCEDGTVTARTCEQARAWVLDGLRPGQELRLGICTLVEREVRR